MDEQALRFRLGVMVLATVCIVAILAFLFEGWPSLLAPTYTVRFKFTEAPGVIEYTPIKKSGILIGRVTKVQLIEEGGAMVTAKIDADKTIRTSEAGRITTSLLGDSVIHIVASGRHVDEPAKVEDNALLEGIAYDDPMQVVAKLQDRLSGAIGSVAQTSDELGKVARRIDGLLQNNEARINSVIAKADETAVMFQKTIENVNAIVGDPQMKSKLTEALEQAPLLLRDTRETIAKVGATMQLVDKNLQNLDRFTESLGDSGEELFGRLGRSTEKLDRLLGELVKLTETVNSGEGTLGQLVHDPELYKNITRTIANVEELTRRARPIVDDVRVFTDSIARHPEKLGVRGALERSQGTKW